MIREFGFNEFLLLVDSMKWTLVLTGLAFAGSLALGLMLLLALISMARGLRIAALGWIHAIQGTPLLGQIFLVYFGLAFLGYDVPRLVAATAALAVYGSAFLADIWQGAVAAVPKGQWEGSAALGLPRLSQLRLIILPQALTIAIPPTVGFLVQLVKNTSLASVIGVVELARESQLVNGATFAPFTIYACVCGLYFTACYPLTQLSRRLETAHAARRT